MYSKTEHGVITLEYHRSSEITVSLKLVVGLGQVLMVHIMNSMAKNMLFNKKYFILSIFL